MENKNSLKFYIFIFFIIFSILCIFAYIYLNNSKPNYSFHLNKKLDFQKGDLVFRLGDVYDSTIISKLSNCDFSHIGMVIKTNPVLIIHATTNDYKDKPNQVLIDSLDGFLSHSKKFALGRISPLKKDQIDIIINNLLQKVGKPFVLLPEKNSKNLYCTTLLNDEISKFIDLELKYQKINVPFFNGEYLFPREFYKSKFVKIIYKQDK